MGKRATRAGCQRRIGEEGTFPLFFLKLFLLQAALSELCEKLYICACIFCILYCILCIVYFVLCIANSVCGYTHPPTTKCTGEGNSQGTQYLSSEFYAINNYVLCILSSAWPTVQCAASTGHPQCAPRWSRAHHGHTWCHREESSSPTWRRCKVKVRTDASGKRDWFSISKFSLGEKKHFMVWLLWWLNFKRGVL